MEAVTDIWKNFDSAISALICKKVNRQDYCKDILQEVYIRIIHNIDKINKADNKRSYLLRIADNAVTDYYRDKRNKQNSELPEAGTIIDDSQILDRSLQLADCCLRPMIELLEPPYRDALIMTELAGMTQRKFAEKVGISTANAKIRVHRAKLKLKDIIANCCNYSFDGFGNVIDKEEKFESCCV